MPPRYPLALLLAVLLAGCETPPTVPPYTPPPPAAGVVSATVSGSLVDRNWPVDDEVSWVSAVDRRPVHAGGFAAGRARYQEALALSPGPRLLTVAYSQGKLAAAAEVRVVVQPGQSLRARVQTRRSSYIEKLSGKDFVLLWIEDAATGQPVSEQVQVFLSY